MGLQPVYDVIVVGSGASGGIASYVLAMKGLKVLCLEAGRPINPFKDFLTHKFDFQLPFHNQGKPGQYGKLPAGMGYKITEKTDHLYTIPDEDPYALAPGSKFTWTRLRAVGGRSLVWGPSVERFGPLDFKPKSLQGGWGEDWPISYDDMAPYYSAVEQFIGVAGPKEGMYNVPVGKNLLPPFHPRCGELLIKDGAAKLGIKTMPQPLAALSRNYHGRPKCHFCGACIDGCMTGSRYSSIDAFRLLQSHSNFTLQTYAAVNTVLMDSKTGKAKGVSYIDTRNKQEYEVYSKAVVLAASNIESVRILLNSRNRDFPSGLANSSGTLGHYLTEHVVGNSVGGFFPQLAGRPTTNDNTPGNESALYIPRYYYGHKPGQKFVGGWSFRFYMGCGAGPGPGARLPGFGSAYKKRIKELYPTPISISGYGEGLALFSNYVEIDPDGLRDPWGIPQVRFHTRADYPNACALMDEMYGQAEEILKASGAEIFPYKKAKPAPLGATTHCGGGARMGDDPKASVTDKWCRCHDVKNLLLADAAPFVTHPEKEWTLTIMALAHRTADHLAEEIRLGNV